MTILKRDTTPLTLEDLMKLKYKLNPYEYTLLKKGMSWVLVIRSPRSSPDIINDLEMIKDKLEPEDLEIATSACILSDDESTNVSLSILWSLLDRRMKEDREIVDRIKGKINRNYGMLLFNPGQGDGQGLRLAIRIPMPSRVITPDNLVRILSGLDIPMQGEVVYIIGDDGFKRFNGKKFFKLLEEERGTSLGGGASSATISADEKEIQPGEDAIGVGGEVEDMVVEADTSPLEESIEVVGGELAEFMPKITRGGGKRSPKAPDKPVSQDMETIPEPPLPEEDEEVSGEDFITLEEPDAEVIMDDGTELACPNCGASLPEDAAECPACGTRFEEVSCECPECGTVVDCNATSCPNCGALFQTTEMEGLFEEPQEAEIVEEVLESHEVVEPEGITEQPIANATDEEQHPQSAGTDEIEKGLVGCGYIVERKRGIMGLDYIVRFQPSPDHRPYEFAAAYRDVWTERDAMILDSIVRDYGYDGALLIGSKFPIDVRLFVSNRNLYMIDIEEIEERRLDLLKYL